MDNNSNPQQPTASAPLVKRGRKPKPYIASWGEVVPGLRRRPDDMRWVLSDGRMFTEHDERKAVERAKLMLGNVSPAQARMLTAHELPSHYWKWIAEQIRNRPAWVAEQTGIEQLAYLADLRPPEKLPTLEEMEEIWKGYKRISKQQSHFVLVSWRDFVKTAHIGGLRDITPQVVVAYREAMYARELSGKHQTNTFSAIRRFLSYIKEQAIATKAIAEALLALEALVPSESATSLDPKPISRDDYRTLLSFATDPMDRAMLLLMLNAAMYVAEVVRVRWEDIKDGTLICRRSKTGKCLRVCVLWAETVEALAAIPRTNSEYIFISRNGKPLSSQAATKRFNNLRTAAKLPKVTTSMLRDGAFTAATEGNVNEQLVNLLAGHRCGMADHYVLRKPKMVAPACEAVYNYYLAEKAVTLPLAAGAA